MQLRKAILFTILNLLIYSANGQQVNFIKYTVYDGLVANPVSCIYQDTKGFIWIGTYDGLSRYDGYKFTNYTSPDGLSHNLVNTIFETNGKLFIAENNGAVDVIQNNITVKKEYRVSSAANSFAQHNNRLLLTTDSSGFYEFKNDSVFSLPKSKNISSFGHFISLNDSVLLCSGVDDELFLLNNDFKILSYLEIPAVVVYQFFKDSKAKIWACTSSGLKLIQVTMDESPHISIVPSPLPFNTFPLNNVSVTSIIEEQDGSFWFGTFKGLVHLFTDGKFHIYTEKDGLPSAKVNYLFSDNEKNLWIGTSQGLAKWVSKNNVVFYNSEILGYTNDVFALSSHDDQKIILLTLHGLQEFNLNSKEFKDINIPDNHYGSPIAGTSPLLLHYGDRIGILDNGTNSVVPVEKLDTAITGIISAQKHQNETIFLASFSGLYAVYKKTIKKILPYRMTSLGIDQNGHIWVGTWENGLFCITVKNSSEGLYDTVDMTASVNGENQIRGLYVDSKNNIWVGTRYGGAFCLTANSKDSFDIQHFNRQSGLMSDWVISFAETKTNNLWVGTFLGLDKLVKDSSGYRIFNFSKAVNFFAEIKKISPFNDQWICVANTGIAIFKDEDLHISAPLKPLIFSCSMGLLDDKLTINLPINKISLQPRQNAARFEFGSPGFINERQIFYSYRLKGSGDTTWSIPSNIHEASYASLSPGNYTFEVKALGWNGEYSAPTSFSFHIKTPFWKQWWFIGICALLIAALFYSLYRYRIKQIIKLQHVRNTIATDLHDEIGSSLTNISILAELSRNKNQQNAFAENLPGRISEESTLAQQALDDIIWSVNSNNDNLNQTMARMRRYAAEVFEPVGINCRIDFANIEGETKLNMEQRKDIYLVFKECLNNIIKHANAKNIFIKIELDKNIFHLKIQDDGKGFDPLKQTDRNGVKNIRSRIQRWNGKLNINSVAGGGTKVDCNFPLASPK